MRWIPVTERLPEGADAVSCEAWCAAEEPGEVAGPCIMGYDADAPEEDRWHSREDTGCWEPGPVTHWRPRPEAPWQEDMLMGVIGADGHKHCLYRTRAEEDAAVARSPLKVAEDLMALARRVGAAIPDGVVVDRALNTTPVANQKPANLIDNADGVGTLARCAHHPSKCPHWEDCRARQECVGALGVSVPGAQTKT